MLQSPPNRYSRRFAAMRDGNRRSFIPFTILGFPDAEICLRSIKLMIDKGATALELGIAFSDPVADGPIIQKAALETLERGFSVNDSFALIKRVRDYAPEVPIGILTYYNIVLARGVEKFFCDASASGVDSILIADLTPDAADEIADYATKFGVALVFIVSPLTDDARLTKIASLSTAYIYVVSRLGITGTEERQDDQLGALLQRAAVRAAVPLFVGFGVSSAEQAGRIIELGADGVITGSKIVQLIGEDVSLHKLAAYLTEMVAATAVAAAAAAQ